MATLYGHYEKGHLYRPGGIENQPAFYLRAMNAFSAAFADAHRRNQERMAQKAKAQGRRR